MIYRLRKKDGSVDDASSGSFIAADGSVRYLRLDELRLTPARFWQSTKTHVRYPIGWRVEIPPLGVDLEITTPVEAQELVLDPVTYWEGVIDVRGTRDGHAVKGHGYLELTGYAGAVVGLSAPE
jgi:predicted secreted hydrolase